MLPNHRLYVRREECKTMAELTKLVIDHEDFQKEIRIQDQPTPKSRHELQVNSTHPTYSGPNRIQNLNRNTCCWRCGKIGHNRRVCRSRSILFCSHCGSIGIILTVKAIACGQSVPGLAVLPCGDAVELSVCQCHTEILLTV